MRDGWRERECVCVCMRVCVCVCVCVCCGVPDMLINMATKATMVREGGSRREREREREQACFLPCSMKSVPAGLPLSITSDLASQCTFSLLQNGATFFCYPPEPVPVDGPMWVYYNRKKGPLAGGGKLQLKCGVNKW